MGAAMPQQTNTEFWMVYGLGQKQPTVRHKTYGSAEAEAKRLAKLHPEIPFFVLAPISVSIKIEVDTAFLPLRVPRVDRDEEIPF